LWDWICWNFQKTESNDDIKKIGYRVWGDMISRCYSDEYKRKHKNSYQFVTVCEEWFNFQNFYIWFKDNYINGYQLDKDLLCPINSEKIYSPNTCLFLPKKLNVFLAFVKLNQGIDFRKDIKKFRVRLNSFETNRGIRVCYFDNREDAETHYKINKNVQIDKAKDYMRKLNYDESVINKLKYLI